jgi:hypothetical protein
MLSDKEIMAGLGLDLVPERFETASAIRGESVLILFTVIVFF